MKTFSKKELRRAKWIMRILNFLWGLLLPLKYRRRTAQVIRESGEQPRVWRFNFETGFYEMNDNIRAGDIYETFEEGLPYDDR
jgi:hypothetical protein